MRKIDIFLLLGSWLLICLLYLAGDRHVTTPVWNFIIISLSLSRADGNASYRRRAGLKSYTIRTLVKKFTNLYLRLVMNRLRSPLSLPLRRLQLYPHSPAFRFVRMASSLPSVVSLPFIPDHSASGS